MGSTTVTYNQFSCQEHYHLNTPPILIVPDRNWRISENEPVGQIIARIRADDPENDDLIYGLEAQYKVPFHIDPVGGVVYLNESLVGRGGESFFLYITVTDGELTAKNEVYVNVLSAHDTKNKYYRTPPSIAKVLNNVTLLLPSFDRLPGVQSIRNQAPNFKFSNMSPANDSNIQPVYTSNVDTHISKQNNGNDTRNTNELKSMDNNQTRQTTTQNWGLNDTPGKKPDNFSSESPYSENDKNVYQYSAQIYLITVTICSIFLISVVAISIVYRRRLCSFGKNLNSKSKEEMARASNQSNFSSMNLNDDSRNSMVLNQWHGPMAYNNRYVPWESDHQRNPHKNEQWEFPRHKLKFFNILGEGAFGQVWRCEAAEIGGTCGITTVAVKTLKENATEAEKKDLLSELEVMKSLESHVNVVGFLGCCTDKDPIFVIIEYVNKGKLQTYLRSSRAERHYGNTHGKSDILTSGDLTSFMYQVANGMHFLTSRGIIHRDLAARNILITDDHICKVADFGFARDVITSKIYERKSEGKLPIRWMAIESLYDNIFSAKSDIWSFGILMWEIVTLGSTPYPGYSAAEVMRKVRDGYRLEKPEHCRRELYNIMYYCWSKDPNDRPSFEELVQMLDRLLQAEMEYIELERFPDHNYYNIPSVSGEKV
ncbi:tyrosine kinase receptor Cad96Ca [Musca vetustissima]|uniref:tyrosine kinase receptor Cad96Ca n=1 Tax=Musca vetustissima TaxID=27455 RepID=UPI002AB7314F|nr:tyrosine kinase receptor Cad96Ca [Musca vetustissima]